MWSTQRLLSKIPRGSICRRSIAYCTGVCQARGMSKDTTHARGHYAASKDQVLTRLRRAEGQVRGIAGMVEEDRYCIDVLQQISAAQAALDKVALALVDAHVRHGVLHADSANRPELVDELMAALGRLTTRR